MIVSGVFTSLAGILVRLVEAADGWTLLFYRMAAFLVFMAIFLGWRYGARLPYAFLALGRSGLLISLTMSCAFVSFVFALIENTVAQVVFIGSTTPLFAALLAWVFLQERLPLSTWLAMGVAVLGVGLMVGEGVAGGSLLGTALALAMTLSFSLTLVGMRAAKTQDSLPAVAMAGVIILLVSAVMTPTFAITGWDLGVATVFGVVQLGFQYVLITYGARHVPAGEIAFFARIQVILAPLWVWIGVGEVPSNLTLIGGAVVISAVAFNSIARLRAS